MFIFGWGGRQSVVREGSFQCPVCRSETPFGQFRQRNWFRLFFIPIVPISGAKEFVVCRKCQSSFQPESLDGQGAFVGQVPVKFSTISLIGMIVGLFSLFTFCLFLFSFPMAIVAVILGHTGLKEVRRNAPHVEGGGFAVAALATGYTALLLSGLVAGLLVVLPKSVVPRDSDGLVAQGDGIEDRDEGPLVISDSGSEALRSAEYEIASKRDQPAGRGNSQEAIALASEFTEKLKELSDELFTSNRQPLIQLSDGEYLTFCELHEDHCLFLVHVPSYRKFTGDAKKALAEIAWAVAQVTVAGKLPADTKLGVGLRGVVMYGDIMIGTAPNSPDDEMTPYRTGTKDDLVAFFDVKAVKTTDPVAAPRVADADGGNSRASGHGADLPSSALADDVFGSDPAQGPSPFEPPLAAIVDDSENDKPETRLDRQSVSEEKPSAAAANASPRSATRQKAVAPQFKNKIPIRLVRKIENEAWPFTSLALSPDGKWLAGGKLDQSLYVFDVASGSIVSEVKNLNELGQVTSLAFSSTGENLVAGGYSGQTVCWKINANGGLQDKQSQYRFDSDVQQLLTSPKYSFLLGASRKGTIAWQSFGANKSQPRLLQEFRGEVRAIWLPTHDNEALASDGSKVLRFSLIDGEVLSRRELGVRNSSYAGFSPSGERLAVAASGSLHIYEFGETNVSREVELPRGETIHALSFHPNENWVALGMRGKIAIVDYELAEVVAFAETESISYQSGLVFSADGKSLAAISQTSMDSIKFFAIGH